MEFRVESLQVHVWHFSHLYVYPGYSLSFRRRALFAANKEMSEVVFPSQASFSVTKAQAMISDWSLTGHNGLMF